MENYRITVESFGSECPTNWEEIADFLNNIIMEKRESVDAELDEIRRRMYDPDVSLTESHDRITAIENDFDSWCENLWETFCSGELTGAPDPIF